MTVTTGTAPGQATGAEVTPADGVQVVEMPMQAPAPKKGDRLTRGGTVAVAAPRLGQIVTAANRWRENYNPLRSLTMRRVVELQELAQRGDTAWLQWLYRKMERNFPTLSALITRCENPLLTFGWKVVVKDEFPEVDEAVMGRMQADPELRSAVEKAMGIRETPGEGPAEEALESQAEQTAEEADLDPEEVKAAYLKAAAERQQRTLRAAYGRIDNLKAAVQHLHLAEFRGYAHLQKHRDQAGNVVHLEPLSQWCVCRDGLEGNWFWNPDSRSTSSPLQLLGQDFCIGGASLPIEDFIIREVPRPIDEIALTLFVRYALCEKDADGFLEIYGIPGGVVIMPGNVPQGKEGDYETAAKSVAEGGSGALPNGSDYKPNDGPRGVDPFTPRLRHLQEELVLAGTGGKLTMLAESGSGTLAGGAHADTFGEIADGRAQKISERFQRDFDAEVLGREHPGEPVLVYFKWGKPDSDSAETVAFKRELVKSLAAHELLSRVLANQTDLKATVADAGLPVNEEYNDPYVPVTESNGAAVTGEVVRDGEGDVVGGVAALPAQGEGVKREGVKREEDGLTQRREDAKEEEDEPKLKNRAAANSPDGRLEDAGAEAYARALAHDLQVMREECEALDRIEDERVLAQRAVALANRIDELKADLAHLPSSARALAETMLAAFFTGLTQKQKTDTNSHE